MMLSRTLPIIALAGAALFVQCKNREPEPSSTRTTGATATEKTGALTTDDKDFITKATESSLLQVKLGQAASQKATNPEVQTYAKRMVTDHEKALDELKKLAEKKGYKPPTDLDKDGQDELDELMKTSGAKLDRDYADDVADDDHVKDFRDAAKKVSDPELHAWANKTLPLLESHLAEAKSIESRVKHHHP